MIIAHVPLVRSTSPGSCLNRTIAGVCLGVRSNSVHTYVLIRIVVEALLRLQACVVELNILPIDIRDVQAITKVKVA